MATGLSPTIEGDYERDGAVCVRGAFSAEHMALAEEAIEAVLADLSSLAKRASHPGDGAFVEDWCSWRRIPAMEQFARRSPAAEIAALLTASTTIRLHHDHVLVKEPGTRQRTPWHQDLPYYDLDGHQNVSMWLPVDPVEGPSSLQCIAGSHRGPWYLPRTFLDGVAAWFPEGTLDEMPDFGDHSDDNQVLSWDLSPGDAVFFHMLTVHGAGPAGDQGRRRVLSLRFVGDDMVHVPRPWPTSPPFPGLADQLSPGAALDHPLFPVLWSAPRR